MKHSSSFLLPAALSAALALVASGFAARVLPAEARAADPAPEPTQRYPYDPVCPWGRVADGQGMLVRCLSSAEASQLAASALAPVSARQPVSAAPTSPETAPAAPAAPVGAAPLGIASLVPPPSVVPDPVPAAPAPRILVKAVHPAKADTGELPEAHRQLGRAEQRYVQCVGENGGIEGTSARVTFRFLVRERGRAEGVTVKERRGVSPAAAKCIAEVIDRRYVGYPAAPIVGATLSIDLGAETVP